mmetsp:Transcript_42649/g.96437  ORF Transcript_42649/g.96437 Transcript_42649/m.96437 type:complete len:243 (-) Transcript_42649:396-1124(-)
MVCCRHGSCCWSSLAAALARHSQPLGQSGRNSTHLSNSDRASDHCLQRTAAWARRPHSCHSSSTSSGCADAPEPYMALSPRRGTTGPPNDAADAGSPCPPPMLVPASGTTLGPRACNACSKAARTGLRRTGKATSLNGANTISPRAFANASATSVGAFPKAPQPQAPSTMPSYPNDAIVHSTPLTFLSRWARCLASGSPSPPTSRRAAASTPTWNGWPSSSPVSPRNTMTLGTCAAPYSGIG